MTNFPFLCYRLVRWGDRAPHPGLRILHFAGLHGGIQPGRVPHPAVHAVELPLPPASRPQPAWTRSAITTGIVKWTTVNVNHCLTVRLIYAMCSTSGAWTWKKTISAAFPSRVFVQSSVEPAQILQSVLRRYSHQNLSTQTAHREGAQGNYIYFLTHSALETKFCSSSLDAFKCAYTLMVLSCELFSSGLCEDLQMERCQLLVHQTVSGENSQVRQKCFSSIEKTLQCLSDLHN